MQHLDWDTELDALRREEKLNKSQAVYKETSQAKPRRHSPEKEMAFNFCSEESPLPQAEEEVKDEELPWEQEQPDEDQSNIEN